MSLQSRPEGTAKPAVTVRPLKEADVSAADSIMRLAFGTFLGLPEPASFMGDASYVRTRWKANPEAAFAAEVDNELVGSNFCTSWGSVGFFGPLTIRPDFWDRGLGKRLMEPVLQSFATWGTRHTGLFTFPHSQKHIGLYQKFGFSPRFLTAIMSRSVEPTRRGSTWTILSRLAANERDATIAACSELTNAIYEGLDVGHEIRAVAEQSLGGTLLLWNESRLKGFAVCHSGAATEAGSGVCYVKFGAVRPAEDAQADFSRLLDACEEFAYSKRASAISAGVNTARHEAYREMLARRFRIDLFGVSMVKPNEPGYNRPGVYILDDWR